MSKRHDAKGRSRSDAAHVRLHHWFLDCPAWGALTPQARAVYLLLARRYNGFNNARISLSVREAEKGCNIARRTAQRALEELQDAGFIELMVKGSFHIKQRHASTWRLTVYPTDDASPTKEFMQKQPSVLPCEKSSVSFGVR